MLMHMPPNLLLAATALIAMACASARPPAAPAPAPETPAVETPLPSPAVVPTVVRETVTVADPETERRLSRLELRLLERDAQVEDLQTRLDDTRAEFVRTLARFQTTTSRAEAASGIAEAEVALQSLKARAGSQQADAVVLVTKMVEDGAAEFNKNNYGGALYLASQAKLLAGSYQGRAGDARGALRPGETAFALPIRLKATSRANVREGPGTTFAVLFSVANGGALTGQSYADDWIRVTDETGRTGWISRTLVAKR
jgi:hypothetical protein